MRRTGSVSVFWNTVIYQNFLELFLPFWQITQRVASAPSLSFLFGFSVSAGPHDESPRTSSLILSLLIDAECCVGVTASCDEDVRDVGEGELEELVDRPGTTIVTKFAELQFFLSVIFDEVWFLTTGPMPIIPLIFAEFFE